MKTIALLTIGMLLSLLFTWAGYMAVPASDPFNVDAAFAQCITHGNFVRRDTRQCDKLARYIIAEANQHGQ